MKWFKRKNEIPKYTILIQKSDGTFLEKDLYFSTEFLAYQYARKNERNLCEVPYTLYILEKEENINLPIWSIEVLENDTIRHNYKN